MFKIKFIIKVITGTAGELTRSIILDNEYPKEESEDRRL